MEGGEALVSAPIFQSQLPVQHAQPSNSELPTPAQGVQRLRVPPAANAGAMLPMFGEPLRIQTAYDPVTARDTTTSEKDCGGPPFLVRGAKPPESDTCGSQPRKPMDNTIPNLPDRDLSSGSGREPSNHPAIRSNVCRPSFPHGVVSAAWGVLATHS